MMNKKFFLTIVFSLFILFSIGSVNAVWWDSSFALCKNITIDNTANANTLTNYAVWINITNATNMEGDFSDIRFVNAGCNQGGSELHYWIEKQVNSNFAETWVEVDSIPASSSKNISMYYNASGIVSKSNIQDTFPVGDDFNDASFNTTKWNNTVGNYIEDGGFLYMNVSVGGQGASIFSFVKIPEGSQFKIRKNVSTISDGTVSRIGWSSAENFPTQGFGGANATVFQELGALYTSLWTGGSLTQNNEGNIVTTNMETHSIYRNSSNVDFWYKDTFTRTYSNTAQFPHDSESVWLSICPETSTANQYIDWVFGRLYTAPDPSTTVTEIERGICDVYIDSCQELNSANTYYCLNQTISTSSNCFNVTANNVTLDCKGYTMAGNGGNIGIYTYTNNQTTVEDCIFTNWNTVIYFDGSNYPNPSYPKGLYGHKIYNNTISSYAFKGFVYFGIHNIIIANNTMKDVTDYCIQGGHLAGDNGIIENNTLAQPCEISFDPFISSTNISYNNFSLSNIGFSNHGAGLIVKDNIFNTGIVDDDGGTNYYYNNIIKDTFRSGASPETTVVNGGHIGAYNIYGHPEAYQYFIDTNITDEPYRQIIMQSGANFRYKKDSNWINTTVATAQTFKRRLYETNTTYMKWFDDGVNNFYYTLGGLNTNTKYDIYDNSTLKYTLTSDSNGALPTFNITLGSGHEIVVQQHISYLEITYNYSTAEFGTLTQGTSNNPANNQLSGVYNVTVNASDSYNVSANATNLVSGGYNIPVNNLKMDTNDTAGDLVVGSAVTLSGSEQLIDTYNNTVTANFHGFWLSVPSYQYATSYQGNITITYVIS